MIHAEGALRRTGVGHPPIDDREQVLGYFAGHLPMGLSVSKIAKPGLKIYGYALGPDGRTKQLTVLRELNAPTLERRYRELRKQLDDANEWRRSEPVLTNAQFIGAASLKDPIGFGEKPQLKRGRPRKKHTP